MIGRKPFNPNAYVPPVDVASPPIPAAMTNSFAQLPTANVKAPAQHNWVGILADALSGLAGNGPIYAPMAARRQDEQTAFERGEETWKSHHAQELADALTLQADKRAHPDDEFTRQLDAAGITDPAQRAEYARKRLERSSDPLVTTSLPGDRIYSGPQSGLAAALGGITAPRASPMGGDVPIVSDAAGYAALPPGAQYKSPDGHIRVKGGPTQGASATFPGSR
jgi:hypothetical protein